VAGELLYAVTLITYFLGMVISLWFAIYLLARSLSNPLTFRAVIALLATAFYFNVSFSDLINANANSGSIRSLAVLVALIAIHNLTHILLPLQKRKQLDWLAYGIILLGLLATFLLFTATESIECDPLYTCPSRYSIPWLSINFVVLLFYTAIAYNLWSLRRSPGGLENVAFFAAVLLGTSTIGYSGLTTALDTRLPRLVPSLLMLFALVLLLYSVARNRTFITRRASAYDLPVASLTIITIVGIYALSVWQMRLSPTASVLLIVLAIFSHSTYDFVRELLDRLFRRQEQGLRRELRHLARYASSGTALQQPLSRGLAILCHNLRASNGWIALSREGQCEVLASLHALPVGTKFLEREITWRDKSEPDGVLKGRPFWFIPAYAGTEQVAWIGIGPRKDGIPFGEEDLFWLEDIAEEIGWMIFSHGQRTPESGQEPVESTSTGTQEELGNGELLTTLAYKLEPELVKYVEDGFRNLNDYSKLGKSHLASTLGIQAQDHIERGKLVQRKLTETVEKLRPAGEPPREPLPRTWYAYTILHDAYVEERLAREIMAKLYISEGTYYRLRRHALRGVTRALLEMGAIN
jgi:hypothetical protein